MAYFNHAFKKTFVMSAYVDPVPGTPTAASGALTSGQLSLYDAKTWAPLDVATPSKCQFVIASGAPYANDKVGAFHGGYKESIKSKGINPKFITKVWGKASHAAQNAILHVGKTPYTQVSSASTPNCCPKFLCGENYHLRIDVKGNAPLRALNHNAYEEITAYTGCCPDGTITPTQVNPVTVYLEWSKAITDSPILSGQAGTNSQFLIPVVYVTQAGDAGAYAAGMTLIWPDGTGLGAGEPGNVGRDKVAAKLGIAAGTITNTTVSAYETAGIPTYTDECAGMSLVGAYQDTQFGDCTFQPSDNYMADPLRIYASEVDLNGDPCEFTGVCVVEECPGRKASGLGETLARDFIMSESYRQVPMATDLRIREITQGNDMLGTGNGQVDRTALYDMLYILHNIPRYNNPSGTFDNDQYLLQIAGPAGTLAAGALKNLKDDIDAVTTAVGNTCVNQTDEAGTACATPSISV